MIAAEQKARVTYDNILRLAVDDPDVTDVIRFLREREIVHFQRFGEAIELAKEQYSGAYAMAWGRYDVKTGCWAVVFSKDSSGGNTVTCYVDSAAVSDEEPPLCREGPMEDGEK